MLSQAHRRSIHSSLTPILGEEETDALMSEFPASPRDDPATTTDLALLRSDIHQDFADFKAEVHQDFADFRAEVHQDFADFKSEIHQDIADFKAEVHLDISGLRAEVHQDIAGFRAEVHDLFRQMAMWMVGAMIAGMGLAAGIGAAVAQVGGG
ncbi:MAG TPA: hypothetical protein VFU19_04080 [Iamia sp.]|nr:hypothetical protein [Iamia sp.]